jgi:hypothetical protein
MQTADARHTLLRGLIDHAPTFPPAALTPPVALAEDGRAASSPHAFLLGRLVWPASLLAELPPSHRAVSAVLDAPLPPGTTIAAAETRYREDLSALAGLADEVYVEVPIDDHLEERLDELVTRGLRAKVRCGGEAQPAPSALAHFVRACRTRSLVFKATAGLHRAVRANGDHGFLNLLAAVVFAGDEDEVLDESEPGAFALGAESFSWRGRHARPDELARVRSELFHSIGSCSFFEPVEELVDLGVLPS